MQENKMEPISPNSIKALLFDLGGVVIDIDFNRVFAQWAKYSDSSANQIKSKFTFDHHYEAHERGEISSQAYFDSLRNSLDIDIPDAAFEDGWNFIFKGEFPGISTLLNRLKDTYPLYAFTNSNPVHQSVWSKKYAKTLSHFQVVYNSSDIGKRKPEPEAFEFIAESIGVKLYEMIFFDDSIENIIGARKVGLNTVHVRSIADVERSVNTLIK